MRLTARRRSASLRGERGFSLILAIVVLGVTTLLLFAAIDAVIANVNPTRTDLDQKRALLAADAGLAAYEQQLNTNQNYWNTCPGPGGATGVTTTTGQTGTTVPGSTDDGSSEYYTYANMPATGTTYTGCSTTFPVQSTIEQSTGAEGTFRVKVTGSSGSSAAAALSKRTIVAQFEPASFLDYVYFSNFEDSDPQWLPPETDTQCAVYAWAGRTGCAGTAFGSGDAVNGPLHSNDTVNVACSSSSPPTFGRAGASPSDAIQTPNNPFAACTAGQYTLNGTLQDSTATGYPGTLPLPPSNQQLQQIADGGNTTLGSSSTLANDCSVTAGCVFDGPTTIVLDGPVSSSSATNDMTVTNGGVTSAPMPYPANGVIYVAATSGCVYKYSPFGSENQLYGGTTLDTNTGDTDNAGCGDAVVEGNTSASSCPGTTQVSGVCPYTQSMTIDAANDIIIAGSLTTTSSTSGCTGEASCPSGTAVLGLIANNNVRIFHPLGSARYTGETEQSCLESTGGTQDAYLNTNGTGSLINPVIDAAILALNDSFIVDDFDCGSSSNVNGGGNAPSQLGTLTINGAIAQNFRGRVAEGNPQVSGYTKNYWYDQRLATIAPPYFLNPVSAAWQVKRVTECDSSSSC
jgi:Tfp pilus assembly protein PilX